MNAIQALVKSLRSTRTGPLSAFIYDLDSLRRHASRLIETLPAQCMLFYAMKANSEAPLLQALHPIVHGFEAASLGEIAKARAVSPQGPVIFGGPGKTDAELLGAMKNRVSLIHVESPHELQRLEFLAAREGRVVDILLRVNLRGPLPSATKYMADTPTQFGIEEGDIPTVITQALACPHLRVRGFHFHSVSNDMDAPGRARLVAHYVRMAKAWAAEFALEVTHLNAGGGIGVNYQQLDRQFDWEAFVTELGPLLKAECPPHWTVLFECGRYLTASCGYYAVEVLDIKRTHGKTFAIVRGGTHQFRLPSSWQHSHPFLVAPVDVWAYPHERPASLEEPVTVVGQLCTPKDVLARDVQIQQLRAGDIVVFLYAGAYGWSISHHDFLSHPHPEQIFLEGGLKQ
jgi:diaminopimelate decarboxylase